MEKKTPTFEEALKRLEEIVRCMESSEVPLDRSLEMFEEGVSLVKICTEALDRAEQKVKILTGSGELKDMPPMGDKSDEA